MGGFSIWHWLVLLIVVGLPLWLIYMAVRIGVRHGMRDSERASTAPEKVEAIADLKKRVSEPAE